MIAVLVWSEELRNPELARRFESGLAELRTALAAGTVAGRRGRHVGS